MTTPEKQKVEIVFGRNGERKEGRQEVMDGDIVVFREHVTVVVGYIIDDRTAQAIMQCDPFCHQTYEPLMDNEN